MANLIETELIKAIKAGCPFCEGDNLMVTSNEVTTYRVRVHTISFPEGSTSKPEEEIDWYDSNCFDSRDEVLYCARCNTKLWTVEDGWIPELKGIAK